MNGPTMIQAYYSDWKNSDSGAFETGCCVFLIYHFIFFILLNLRLKCEKIGFTLPRICS